jgi:L-ornithine N5-oxygenase
VEIVDVVGVGFGPSNLALAIALTEEPAPRDRPRAVFLERQPSFGWHRGMLIEDARMQVSFLKDLTTQRNPRSRYGFLSYLQDRDRMSDFINTQNFFPTRLEFHDYLEWAAAAYADRVRYGTEVLAIRPVGSGSAALWEVLARDDDGEHRYLARDVVVGTGLAPHLPPGVETDERVWHNRDLVHRVRELAGVRPERFVVVGAGQSAAESVDYLHRSFPSAEVCAVFARYGFSPADDSPFANRVFDPQGVDDYFAAPQATKDRLMATHRNTNYSVVDPDLITSLHDRYYAERVAGRPRLRFCNVSEVTALRRGVTGVEVVVHSELDDRETTLDADAVVFATGYRSGDPARFFAEDPGWWRDPRGRLVISRDYRLLGDDASARRVFVHGATEHTHGIGSSLLSNVSVRAGEITRAIVDGHRAGPADLLDAVGEVVHEAAGRSGRSA